jgi:hypothetical protein
MPLLMGMDVISGVLSGTSGLVYFIFPQLFLWLFRFADSSFVSAWSLSQFGVLVVTFGLYQMNSELDTRPGHVLWWLILDWVWLYIYWAGVTAQVGPWNPLLFQGGNFWTHSAWHADSTLALARTIFLLSLYFGASNRSQASTQSESKVEKKKAESGSEAVGQDEIVRVTRSSSRKQSKKDA